MKKIFVLTALVTAAWSLSAQEVTVYRLQSSGSYPGYSVPAYIRTDFETNYPGVTVITWEPVNTFWRASYTQDNRITYIYYNEAGVNFRTALPVIQNSVPEEIVTRAIHVYGPVVYGITKMKAANDNDVYQLRLLENGSIKTVWMDADGKAVTDVYKLKPNEEMVMKVKEGS